MLTRRELDLAIFEGTAEGVSWQPRLETWIFATVIVARPSTDAILNGACGQTPHNVSD